MDHVKLEYTTWFKLQNQTSFNVLIILIIFILFIDTVHIYSIV